MTDSRAEGPLYAIENIGFIDFEVKSNVPISSGTYRYASAADAIILVYAIGCGPVRTVAVKDFSGPLRWRDMPDEFVKFRDKVLAGKAIWAAWNMGFDRAIWNFATIGFPLLSPEQTIDVMAQAVAAGLPADLDMGAKMSGATHKMASGKSLINLFCIPGAEGNPLSHPTEWSAFRDYAAGDIEAMRDVYQRTMPLAPAEWEEYWAMERINERGIAIDIPMVKAAARLAEEDKERSSKELFELTEGEVRTVDQVKRMTEWLLRRLPPEGRDILIKREAEIDEFGTEKVPAEFVLTRKQVERLIAYVTSLDPSVNPGRDATLRVLQIRLYGGSKTPAKFGKMLASHVDGILYSQYVFNGASQTGRASSKGVQIHNLARDTLEFEHDTIEALLAGASYDDILHLGDNNPVSRKLSLLVRPSFIPRETTNVFVWSDWAQIEARVLPWLCGDTSPGAMTRLEIFRSVDHDPKLPDLYTRTAATLSGVSTAEVTREMRQRGKVAELALGFMGGKNALQAMAASYGMYFSDVDAQAVVDAWRAANQWATKFAADLWTGMEQARELPGDLIKVGRVGFCWLPGYLGGSLALQLPSGRLLLYRALRKECKQDKNDKGYVIKTYYEHNYARGHGRQKLWPGIFVENVTQATAADVLRGTLVRLENDGLYTRLHVHDEILIETPAETAEIAAIELSVLMREGFDWSDGLPLMSEETIAPYYSKRA